MNSRKDSLTRPVGMKIARRAAGLSALLLMMGTQVMAQEGGSSPVESTTGWVFRWLNFLIVFGLIAYLAVKKGGPAFRGRAEEISRKIAEGARAREAAERQRQEVQTKLADLENEIARMRVDARRDAEAETQRLRSLAREEAHKIERAAEAEIVAAERAARMELKRLAARLAAEGAEILLRKEITPHAEAGLFESFVEELGRSVN